MTEESIAKFPEISLFIAASLDGYIATEDGDISFLSAAESSGEDYGYSQFIQSVDTVIMGRKTYEKIMSFGIAYPHPYKKSYVLSRTKNDKDENVDFWNESVESLLQKIAEEKGKHIFLDGGAETILAFMKKSRIDNYIISVIPVLLGSGIKLFQPGFSQQKLKHISTRSYPSGLVQSHYTQRL